jgi:uncharacterized protein YdhG (YjbR/CyaY superfamily)
MTTEPDPIEAYLAGFDGVARERLDAVRATIRAAAPDAAERISYKMPAFFLGKHAIVFVGGYQKHIGLYPVPAGDEAFRAEIAPYFSGASTIRFPHNRPLPTDLIAKLVAVRLRELPLDGV